MKLRPHHLLCTLSYQGAGYSPEFIDNMNSVVNKLKADIEVSLVPSSDDICRSCPKCNDPEQVDLMDKAVLDRCDLSYGEYKYKTILSHLEKISPADIDFICGGCSWFEFSACKHYILTQCSSASLCADVISDAR